MLDYSMKYRAVRKMLDDVLSTLDRTSDFTKLYELSNRVSAKLELMDEMDRMDPPYMPSITSGGAVERPGQHGEILDIVRTSWAEPGKGKVETADTIKADDAPVVSRKPIDEFPGVAARKPLDRMPADFPPPRTRK